MKHLAENVHLPWCMCMKRHWWLNVLKRRSGGFNYIFRRDQFNSMLLFGFLFLLQMKQIFNLTVQCTSSYETVSPEWAPTPPHPLWLSYITAHHANKGWVALRCLVFKVLSCGKHWRQFFLFLFFISGSKILATGNSGLRKCSRHANWGLNMY